MESVRAYMDGGTMSVAAAPKGARMKMVGMPVVSVCE